MIRRLMDGIECKGETIECTECGDTFYLSAEEDAWFSRMGFQKPKRCPLCRRARQGCLRGEIPHVKVGKRILIPKIPFEKWLHGDNNGDHQGANHE